MYHGIVFDMEFEDSSFPERLTIFAKRKSTSTGWLLYGVEVPDEEIGKLVSQVQANLKSDRPYYAHFYNDEKVIVVFKNRTFEVTPHASSWKPVIEYGAALNIPREQLAFWPNRFQDEIHYFRKEEFT